MLARMHIEHSKHTRSDNMLRSQPLPARDTQSIDWQSWGRRMAVVLVLLALVEDLLLGQACTGL